MKIVTFASITSVCTLIDLSKSQLSTLTSSNSSSKKFNSIWYGHFLLSRGFSSFPSQCCCLCFCFSTCCSSFLFVTFWWVISVFVCKSQLNWQLCRISNNSIVMLFLFWKCKQSYTIATATWHSILLKNAFVGYVIVEWEIQQVFMISWKTIKSFECILVC